jgi:hypothetical protein
MLLFWLSPPRHSKRCRRLLPAKVAVEASLEADRKAKCLLFEKEHRINTKYDLVTPPTKPLCNNGNRGGAVIITGDYVFVTSLMSW